MCIMIPNKTNGFIQRAEDQLAMSSLLNQGMQLEFSHVHFHISWHFNHSLIIR